MENEYAMGGHPLKKMRRQTLEEFEDEFMSSGRPSATVVNMRSKPVEEQQSQKPSNQKVFHGIFERTSLQASTDDAKMPKKKQSLFA